MTILVVFDVDGTLAQYKVTAHLGGQRDEDNFQLHGTVLAAVKWLEENVQGVKFAVCTNNRERDSIIRFLNAYFGGEERRKELIPCERIITGNGMNRSKDTKIEKLHNMVLGEKCAKSHTLLFDDDFKHLGEAAERGFSVLRAYPGAKFLLGVQDMFADSKTFQAENSKKWRLEMPSARFFKRLATVDEAEAVRKREQEATTSVVPIDMMQYSIIRFNLLLDAYMMQKEKCNWSNKDGAQQWLAVVEAELASVEKQAQLVDGVLGDQIPRRDEPKPSPAKEVKIEPGDGDTDQDSPRRDEPKPSPAKEVKIEPGDGDTDQDSPRRDEPKPSPAKEVKIEPGDGDTDQDSPRRDEPKPSPAKKAKIEPGDGDTDQDSLRFS